MTLLIEMQIPTAHSGVPLISELSQLHYLYIELSRNVTLPNKYLTVIFISNSTFNENFSHLCAHGHSKGSSGPGGGLGPWPLFAKNR